MSALEKLFGKKPTPREVARDSKRDVQRNVRDVDREIATLRREETKLVGEIKKAAKAGNEAGTRILAKQLVRLRGQITKMQTTKAQLHGVGLSVTTAATTAQVGQAMGSAGAAMAAMGQAANPQKMQKQMMQFARENEKMGMASEMMDDALEDTLDFEGLEDDAEGVMAQVLDEIGVDLGAALPAAKQQRVPGQKQAAAAPAAAEDDEADELASRLAALK